MSAISKILHWLIFLAFLGLVCTAIAANLLFSKEAIMSTFGFSLPAIGVEIPPADQLFVARIERRLTWAIHFWIGTVFFTFALFRFILFLRGKRLHRFLNLFTFTLIALIFASGLPLFLRIYVEIPAEVQQFARSAHYLLIWLFSLFVILHIAWVLSLENGRKPGIISCMFQFRGNLLLLLAVVTLMRSPVVHAADWAKDPDYLRAVAYMEGKIGVIKGSKSIKNCPYAKCDEVADSVNRNVKMITVKTRNYPRMVAHFKKSVEKGNPLAAGKLAKFLIGRIDYRSEVPDPTLIRIGERDTGMRYDDYVKLARKSLALAAKHGDCYSMYKLAEFQRLGQLGFAKAPDVAETLYQRVVQRCDPKSFFVIMSRSRLKR